MTPNDIRVIKERLRWTYERMARELYVKPRTVRAWVAGVNKPSGPALVLLEQLQARAEAAERARFESLED